MLFTPTPEGPDVGLTDGVIDCGEEEYATLIIENHGTEKLRLKRGMVLGGLEEVDEPASTDETPRGVRQRWEQEEDSDDTGESTSTVGATQMESGNHIVIDSVGRGETGDQQRGMTNQLDGVESTVNRIRGKPYDRSAKLWEQLELGSEYLDPEDVAQIRTLLETYADVFALEPSELGTSSITQHSIKTGDHPPIRQPLRRMPFTLRPQVDKLVKEMLAQGVIQPSSSPWASPVVLVRKKDGTMRFCVDYRRLNSVTKLDEFPLPRIDDTLDVLAGAKYFTTLDMASGYWQVAMEPSSIEKTAFITYSGLYEF